MTMEPVALVTDGHMRQAMGGLEGELLENLQKNSSVLPHHRTVGERPTNHREGVREASSPWPLEPDRYGPAPARPGPSTPSGGPTPNRTIVLDPSPSTHPGPSAHLATRSVRTPLDPNSRSRHSAINPVVSRSLGWNPWRWYSNSSRTERGDMNGECRSRRRLCSTRTG